MAIKTNEKNICPDCNGILKVRDSKKRIVKDEDGMSYNFLLRRFVCCQCGKLHTELPDCNSKMEKYLEHTHFAFLRSYKDGRVMFGRR